MKIGVLWRACRNVELQKKTAPEAVVDDSYEEACQHSKGLEDARYDVAVIEWTSEPMLTYKPMKKEKVDLGLHGISERIFQGQIMDRIVKSTIEAYNLV